MKGMKGTILGLGALAAAAISTVLHHGKPPSPMNRSPEPSQIR